MNDFNQINKMNDLNSKELEKSQIRLNDAKADLYIGLNMTVRLFLVSKIFEVTLLLIIALVLYAKAEHIL